MVEKLNTSNLGHFFQQNSKFEIYKVAEIKRLENYNFQFRYDQIPLRKYKLMEWINQLMVIDDKFIYSIDF